MAWIPSYQELREHPKLHRLARRLGCDRYKAIGHLHGLWWWALDYAPDGSLAELDADDIATAAGWDGDADVFLAGLVESGFLDPSPYALHNWGKYGGKLVEKRRTDAERKRRSSGFPAEVARTSAGGRSESAVREEKRREDLDQIREDREDGYAKPQAISRAAQVKSSKAAREMLTDEQRQRLRDDFPGLARIDERIEEALSHVAAKKVASEYLYLRNWLRKDAEKSPASRNGKQHNSARAGGELKASWDAALGRPIGHGTGLLLEGK